MNGGQAFWPWWLGALALAVVTVAFWRLVGRLLGVSGSLESVLDVEAAREARRLEAIMAQAKETEARLLEATRRAFGDEAVALAAAETAAAPAAGAKIPAAAPLSRTSHGLLLVSIVVGGALAALTGGGLVPTPELPAGLVALVGNGSAGWAMLLGGSLLIGFGTAMAAGCTSGHGLCGTARLQPGSLAATASFFGVAVGVSLLLDVVLR